MEPEPPDFRATVLPDGTVRLVDWGPWLVTAGPLNTLLHARGRAGVGIADLLVVWEDDVAAEVIADFRCGGEPAHREALARWAALVGYRRLWLDDELVELEPSCGGTAETRCSGCRVRFADGDRSFWDFVRRQGSFPKACCLCGSDLPQWSVARRDGRTAAPGSARRPVRSRER